MDFELSHEQRQVLEYGDAIAQKYDRKYWMECAEKQALAVGACFWLLQQPPSPLKTPGKRAA